MNILISSFSFPSIQNNNHDGRFVLSEAVAYAENGAEVRVITPHYKGVEKTEKIHEKVTVIRFAYFFPPSLQVLKKAGEPIYNQKSFLALIQRPILCVLFALHILKHSLWADIIHAQWTVTALLALPAKWLLGKKIVLTARGSDLRLLPEWLNRYIHTRVDAAIDCFGPQQWFADVKRKFPARYLKLPHMVLSDPKPYIPEDIKEVVSNRPESFIVMYVGRFDYFKLNNSKLPILTLIRASNILRERKVDFHVFFVGGGDKHLEDEMFSLINAYSLADYVTMLGVKINVPDYMQYCHLGVGGIAFNAVSQEFTIAGKPQILINDRDNAGTPWRHKVNSIFVEPEDERDLAEQIGWSSVNREQIISIGTTAKDDMKQYFMESRTGGALYIKAFQKLIAGK